MKGINILVAHDRPEIIQPICNTIQNSIQYQLAASVTDGQQALEYILYYKPDVAIIALHINKLDGISIAQCLAAAKCPTKLILIAEGPNQEILRTAIEQGVMGYSMLLTKARVLECLEAITDNEYYIDTDLYHAHYFAQSN